MLMFFCRLYFSEDIRIDSLKGVYRVTRDFVATIILKYTCKIPFCWNWSESLCMQREIGLLAGA